VGGSTKSQHERLLQGQPVWQGSHDLAVGERQLPANSKWQRRGGVGESRLAKENARLADDPSAFLTLARFRRI
jgi:hypothetical protein